MKSTIAYTTMVLGSLLAGSALAEVCQGYGPQTPRDIDYLGGTNPVKFSKAPAYQEMNLCNIHFHANAEHKAKDFSVKIGSGDFEGYQCNATANLTQAQLTQPKQNYCENVKAGDTIEVHWVHTSCDVKPGPTLGACLSDACANPDLRVETQVFMVVNDDNALDFTRLAASGLNNGYHQASDIPDNTGAPVEYLGSTTGPKFTDQACSPLQVTWSVRPQCALIDINALSDWCKDNEYKEKGAQGIRQLVTNPELLAPIH